MTMSLVRRVTASAAVAAVLIAFPTAAAATITGGCTGEGHATSGTADLTTATEWHIKRDDVGGGSATAPGPIKAASVIAYGAGLAIPVAGGTSDDGKTSGSIDGVSASTLAVLGARFIIAGDA